MGLDDDYRVAQNELLHALLAIAGKAAVMALVGHFSRVMRTSDDPRMVALGEVTDAVVEARRKRRPK